MSDWDRSADPTLGSSVVVVPPEYRNTPSVVPGVVAPTPPTSPASRRSILSTIMQVESGGRNIPQGIVDENTRKGTPASGYYQIIDPTWGAFGGPQTGYKSAIDAPYDVQLKVAQNIPVSHWGPTTQAALKAAGYEPLPGETLGAMLVRYGEDPSATKPADGGMPSTQQATAPTTGLLMPTSKPVDAGVNDKLAALLTAQATEKKQKDMDDVMKTGLGLLGPATTAPALQAPQVQVHRPQPVPSPLGVPDFSEILAKQRLQRRV